MNLIFLFIFIDFMSFHLQAQLYIHFRHGSVQCTISSSKNTHEILRRMKTMFMVNLAIE